MLIWNLPVPQLLQILLVHAEVMPDLVQDGLADLADQVGFTLSGQLVVFLR
jgi:hypothetical protein